MEENRDVLEDELLEKAAGGSDDPALSEEERMSRYIDTLIPAYHNSVKNPSFSDFAQYARSHMESDYKTLDLSISADDFLDKVCAEYFKRYNSWSKDTEQEAL